MAWIVCVYCPLLSLPLNNVQKYARWQWCMERWNWGQERHQMVGTDKFRFCSFENDGCTADEGIASQWLHSQKTYSANSAHYGVGCYWVIRARWWIWHMWMTFCGLMPATIVELWNQVNVAWMALPQDTICTLYASMPSHMEQVITAHALLGNRTHTELFMYKTHVL